MDRQRNMTIKEINAMYNFNIAIVTQCKDLKSCRHFNHLFSIIYEWYQ